jgi:hypothetical protein
MYTSFVLACFTVLKFKGKFVFRNYEQFKDNDLCGRKLTSSLKNIQGGGGCWFFVCLFGVIRSSKEEKNFVLLNATCLNVTCL